MNSSEFDRRFEAGESLIDGLDLAAARRPRLDHKRVNVDFPLWMVEQLDLAGGTGDIDTRASDRITPPGSLPLAAPTLPHQIRPCEPANWPKVWALLEPVFRAGETFPHDPAIPEAEVRRRGLSRARR